MTQRILIFQILGGAFFSNRELTVSSSTGMSPIHPCFHPICEPWPMCDLFLTHFFYKSFFFFFPSLPVRMCHSDLLLLCFSGILNLPQGLVYKGSMKANQGLWNISKRKRSGGRFYPRHLRRGRRYCLW